MREIKFRAKDKDGNWQYGYIALVSFVENMHSWRIFNFNNGTKGTSVDPRTKGQYTGLKDKNGKEIYEGDVIAYITGDEMIAGVVEYKDDRFIVNWKPESYFSEKLSAHIDMAEIIGNIYENPELLGV